MNEAKCDSPITRREGLPLCSADISRSGENPGRGPRLVECSNERKGEYGEVFGFLFNTSFI